MAKKQLAIQDNLTACQFRLRHQLCPFPPREVRQLALNMANANPPVVVAQEIGQVGRNFLQTSKPSSQWVSDRCVSWLRREYLPFFSSCRVCPRFRTWRRYSRAVWFAKPISVSPLSIFSTW